MGESASPTRKSAVSEEPNAQLAELFRKSRERSGKYQYQVAEEANVSAGFVGLIEKQGYFPGMRAVELLRLVQYYKLDIKTVAGMLGVDLGMPGPGSTPFAQQVRSASNLPLEEQEWLVEVVDTLLRGMRAT